MHCMSKNIIILGAKGRFGRAATTAFNDAGWTVRAFARKWEGDLPGSEIKFIKGDAFNKNELLAAVKGCNIIVNALNPPYHRWQQDWPKLTSNVIDNAEIAGATILFPGNVYNYGRHMPCTLREDTTHAPTTRKGVLREEIEQSYVKASKRGVQTIILRAGDYIEKEKTGNWFDSFITPKINRGIISYPGATNVVHAWAYLPDMARAMVYLAEKKDKYRIFESFGFPGFNITGYELIKTIEEVLHRPLQVKQLPWSFMKLIATVSPVVREVVEMRYLWDVPHAIDGTKLNTAIPEFRATSVDAALKSAISDSLDEAC